MPDLLCAGLCGEVSVRLFGGLRSAAAVRHVQMLINLLPTVSAVAAADGDWSVDAKVSAAAVAGELGWLPAVADSFGAETTQKW